MKSKKKYIMGRKTSIKPSNNNIGTERTVSYPVHEFDNYFKEDYAIIMNPVPYLKRIIFDIPRRVVGNSIILITKGTAHATFNFKDYPIKAGDILMVPDDNILSIDKFSNDVTPWMVSGNFNSPIEKELVGFDTIFMHLSQEEFKVVEKYFTLMHTIASKPIYGPDDFKHLFFSLMYRIREMHNERIGNNKQTFTSSSKQLTANFINILIHQDVPMPNIKHFAKTLGVSENHLSITVKKETNITVKKWIERKTEATMRMLLIDEANYSLEDICNIIGYSSPPQVVRFFKRRTGMTPFEFRKAKLNEKALLNL